MHYKPPQTTTTPFWFSKWVVGFFPPSRSFFRFLLFHPNSFSCLFLPHFLPPFSSQCLSFDFLLVNPGLELHLSALCRLSDSMTQSTAMRAERGGGVWGSFRTVSLSTWANRKREAGEMLVGKPSTNWFGGELAEWQLMYNNISLPLWPKWALLLDTTLPQHLFSFCFLLSAFWSSLQWKHIPVMPHCCSLFSFLITNSITRMGWSWTERKTGRGRRDRGQSSTGFGDTNPRVANIST